MQEYKKAQMDSLTCQQHGGPNVITGQPLMYVRLCTFFGFMPHRKTRIILSENLDLA